MNTASDYMKLSTCLPKIFYYLVHYCYATTVSVTGQDLYDDVVSVRRSIPANTGSGLTVQTPHPHLILFPPIYNVIETGISQEESATTSHSVVQLDGREIKNPAYIEVNAGGACGSSTQLPIHDQRRQPMEQYNTLAQQVGGRSSNDDVSVQQDSIPTYAVLK